MDGPSHYLEAERALKLSEESTDPHTESMYLEEAKAHALLALTAATAANIRKNGAVTTGSEAGWREIIGAPEPEPQPPADVEPRLVLIGNPLEIQRFIYENPSRMRRAIAVTRTTGAQSLRGLTGPVENRWFEGTLTWPLEVKEAIREQLKIIELTGKRS